MTDVVDTFLAHYGVKGMKWGKRKIARKMAALDKAREKELPKLKERLATHETRFSKMTVPELKSEKAKLQKKMNRLEKFKPDWLSESAGVKPSKSQRLAKSLGDQGVKGVQSSTSLLTSKERMKLRSIDNNSEKNRALRQSLIGGSLQLGAAYAGTLGLIKLSGANPNVQRDGAIGAAIVLGGIGGKIIFNDVVSAQYGRHFNDRTEVDRELRSRGVK